MVQKHLVIVNCRLDFLKYHMLQKHLALASGL